MSSASNVTSINGETGAVVISSSEGPAGPEGATGATGATGPAGPSGVLWDTPPTGVIAETFPRLLQNTTETPGSQQVYATLIQLNAGAVIHSISFFNNYQAAANPTHWWFGLMTADGNMTVLAVTADQGSAAWAGNSYKTLALTSAYTVPASGPYYVICNMVAVTPVNFLSCSTPSNGNVIGPMAPSLAGFTGDSLNGPPTVGTKMNGGSGGPVEVTGESYPALYAQVS